MTSPDFITHNGCSFRIYPSDLHTFDSVKNSEGITEEISGFNVREARFLDSLDIMIGEARVKLSSIERMSSNQRTITFEGAADLPSGEVATIKGKAFIHDNVLHMALDVDGAPDPYEVSVVGHGDFMGTFMQRKYPIVQEDLAAITTRKPGLAAIVGDNEYSGQLYVNGKARDKARLAPGEVTTTFFTGDRHIELAVAAKYRKIDEAKDLRHSPTIASFAEAEQAALQEFEDFHYHLLSVTLHDDASLPPQTQTARRTVQQQLSTAADQLYTLSVAPQIKGMENLKCTAAGYPAFMRPFSRDTLCSILEGGYPPEIVNNTLLLLANTIAEDGHLFHEVYDGPDASLTPFTLKDHERKCHAYDSPNLWLKVLGEYIEQTGHVEFLENPKIKGAIDKIIAWNQSQLETYGYNAYVSANTPECWDEERKIGNKNIAPDHNNGLFHLAWMDGGLAKTTAEGDGFLGYPQGSIELTAQQYDAMQVLTTLQQEAGSLLSDEQMGTVRQIEDRAKVNLQSKFWVEKETLKKTYGVLNRLNEDIIQSVALYSNVSDANKTPLLSEEALANIRQNPEIMQVLQKLKDDKVGVFYDREPSPYGIPYTNLNEDERIQRFVDITNHYAALPKAFLVDIVAGDKDKPSLPSGNLASNIHHALGTKGLLTNEQIEATVEQLSNPEYGLFNPEYGLRTLSEHAVKYVSHEYQRGAIWPYDTALAMKHLRMQGDICRAEGNQPLAQKCYDAVNLYAKALGNMLEKNEGTFPELLDAETGEREKGACDPQQWSLQVPFAMLTALTGMDIKRPASGKPEVFFDPIMDEEMMKVYFPLKISLEIGEKAYEVTAHAVNGKIESHTHPAEPKPHVQSVTAQEPLMPGGVAPAPSPGHFP